MEKEKFLALYLVIAFVSVGCLVGFNILRLNYASNSEENQGQKETEPPEEDDNNEEDVPSEEEDNNEKTDDDDNSDLTENEIYTNYNETEQPSFIILIGDGMGFSHIQLANLVEYGENKSSWLYDFPYITNISTENYYEQITDSAAAGTAISTGYRTGNKKISVDINGTNLKTILEIAEEKGYNTGLVVSSDMRHATPATFAAHNESRDNSFDIGNDMANHGIELLLGGGERYDLFGQQVDYMVNDLGYNYITNRSELENLNQLKSLGLFAENGLMREMERKENTSRPSLYEMSLKALNLLENEKSPYFLMIEGSQIDWACHNNDKIYLAHEMIAFEKIVREVRDLAIKDPTLQVLITADHETGGLSINSYEFSTEIPKENDSLAILIEKRSNRTNEVDVSWSSMGHTNKKVILSGLGAFTEPILKASHLTDIFSMVYNGINYNISIKQTAKFDDSQRKFVLKRTFYFRRANFEDVRKRVFYGFDRKRFFKFLYINIWGLDIPYKMIDKKYLIFDL